MGRETMMARRIWFLLLVLVGKPAAAQVDARMFRQPAVRGASVNTTSVANNRRSLQPWSAAG